MELFRTWAVTVCAFSILFLLLRSLSFRNRRRGGMRIYVDLFFMVRSAAIRVKE